MKTVRVHIAVAVDPKGNWAASGWKKQRAGECMALAVEGLESGESHFYLHADLPIPEVKDVQAEVEQVSPPRAPE